MRVALSALLIAHGVAHLVGFVVPWKLMAAPDVPYRTTILGGTVDIGDAGSRALGVVWLIAALGLMLLGSALLAGFNVRAWIFTLLGGSLALCVVGWPDARIGVVVNVVLIGVLLAMRQLGTACPVVVR
jgi:hypothetical protein